MLLRKAQYDALADSARTVPIARAVVAGKLRNARQNLQRAARDGSGETAQEMERAADSLAEQIARLPAAGTLNEIRGLEGQAAATYFNVFGAMITREKSAFAFRTRSRRPPRDRVNALLSFLYSLLTTDCTAAVSGVGLDPQFGYLHALRPGKPAPALDLMEEFRPFLADRLALTLINRRQLQPAHFEERPGGSVLLNADGRKIVLSAYQTRKQEEVLHPFLKERMPIGLLPHVQARMLARHLRGDLSGYLPFVARG